MEITKTHQDKEKLVINVKAEEKSPGDQTSTISPKFLRMILNQNNLLKGFHDGSVDDLNVSGGHHSNKYGSFNADYIVTKKQKTIENTNNVTKIKTTASKRKAVKQNGKN